VLLPLRIPGTKSKLRLDDHGLHLQSSPVKYTCLIIAELQFTCLRYWPHSMETCVPANLLRLLQFCCCMRFSTGCCQLMLIWSSAFYTLSFHSTYYQNGKEKQDSKLQFQPTNLWLSNDSKELWATLERANLLRGSG
jgi:hypothetical protein